MIINKVLLIDGSHAAWLQPMDQLALEYFIEPVIIQKFNLVAIIGGQNAMFCTRPTPGVFLRMFEKYFKFA